MTQEVLAEYKDFLYSLTQIEQERPLSTKECKVYIKIVEILKEHNVDIDFAIEL